MIHHSSSNYAVASSQAAAHGRQKMEQLIEDGRHKAGSVIEKIKDQVIQDSIVRTRAFKVHASGDGWAGIFPLVEGERSVPLHNHAWQQVLSDAGIDKRFADKMEKEANGTDWGSALVKHNVDTIFSHRKDQRNLVREEGGVVKGWLSDKFRRIDSRPLVDAFAATCKANGLMPIEGYAMDTRVRIRAIIPQVFEPIKNEVMVVGLTWGNSDYGNGGHVLDVFINRVVCTNLATLESVLRQIHLGKRLNDNIEYSQETYRKDQEVNVLALKETVAHVIGPDRINALMEAIAQESERAINKDVVTLLKEFPAIGKETTERIVAAYESPDVVNLPAGNTMWRLSNAVSWIAQSNSIGDDKKLELQDIAGKMLKNKLVTEALAV